jgi:hypothetical protein
MRHTNANEFGSLPTPRATESIERRNWKTIQDKVENGGDVTLTTLAKYQIKTGIQMLPTPTAMDSTNATANMKSTQVKPGSMHSMTLTRMMSDGILPTPRSRDWKGCEGRRGDMPSYIEDTLKITGKTSQLNPRFVAEMMGFPPNWTELPFLNGETNL